MENLKEKENFFNTRTILFIMVFIGFGVNFMMRVNINIAIVHMVKVRINDDNLTSISNQEALPTAVCLKNDVVNTDINLTVVIDTEKNRFMYSIEKQLLELLNIPYEDNGFDWDEHRQGFIFAAFFWLHWATQIPGGMLSRKYGSKLVFGFSNLLCCILCFVIPITAYLDYRYLAGIRALQGMILVKFKK